MPGRAARVRPEMRVERLIAGLTVDELREVVSAAIDRHDDVERQVRLIAARAAGDLAQLRVEVDRGLRSRRFLGPRESAGWAGAARPIVAELAKAVDASPSRALVELVQRAVGHVVKVIMHADDSDGLIGDLARDLLVLHARVCDAGVADPVDLAAWMVRFGFVDQDFFEVDPVRYASAPGEDGLAAYRDAVSARRDGDSFAVRYARERLAILDGDVDALVKLLGGDLASPYQFIRVPRRCASSRLATRCWRGPNAASRRPAAGRSLSCMTLRVGSTMRARSRLRRSRCGARSTSGCRRHRPIARCGGLPKRLTPGRSSKTRRARRCSRQTCAGTSTRSLAMASSGSPGVQLSRLRSTRSVPTSGSGSPRAASEIDPPTRSRSTSGSPTRCSSEPIGARTAPPRGSSSAHKRRRRPPANSKRSASTSRACASGTGGVRP